MKEIAIWFKVHYSIVNRAVRKIENAWTVLPIKSKDAPRKKYTTCCYLPGKRKHRGFFWGEAL